MKNDNGYQFPTPAYTVFGYAWLAVGWWYGVIVRTGSWLYALAGRGRK